MCPTHKQEWETASLWKQHTSTEQVDSVENIAGNEPNIET